MNRRNFLGILGIAPFAKQAAEQLPEMVTEKIDPPGLGETGEVEFIIDWACNRTDHIIANATERVYPGDLVVWNPDGTVSVLRK